MVLRRAAQRDDAEERNGERLFQIFRRLEGIVELFATEGCAGAQQKAQHQRQREVLFQVGCVGASRSLGAVDDGNIVGANPTGNPDLLVALQQPIVEGAVGVDLPLQDRVLDVAIAKVGDVGLQAFDLLGQRLLLAHRRLVLRLDRVANEIHLSRDLLIDFIELRFQSLHLGIVGFEEAELVVVSPFEVGAFGAQVADRLALQHLWHPDARGRLNLLPQKLIPQAFVGCLGEFAVGGGEVALCEGLPVATRTAPDEHDSVLVRILDALLLGVLQLQLQLLQPFFQESAGIAGRAIASVKVFRDVVVDDAVGDILRYLGIRTVVCDLDDGRAVDRLQAHPAEDAASGAFLTSRDISRGGRPGSLRRPKYQPLQVRPQRWYVRRHERGVVLKVQRGDHPFC